MNQHVLGLKNNIQQFSLLVLVNAFVGAMIGIERSILPTIAEREFHLKAKTAILSFIIVFGLVKAITNYFTGRLSDQFGRKKILILGWILAIPVPFVLMWAPSWSWILFANIFLGASQGITWSTTVIMKIDLVGPERRGLAMGLNEFAGYFALAASALLTGFIADEYGLRPQPFYLGIVYIILGLGLSISLVKDTMSHVSQESQLSLKSALNHSQIFLQTTFSNKNLSSVTQAGLVNNLNDGMAWGLFPIVFTMNKMNLKQIGFLAALFPAVWGLTQLYTGHLSDSIGRKWPIAWGMWIQAIGIAFTALSSEFWGFATGGILLGIGTAMVYPTLLAAIGDIAHPSWRASSIGVYRFWRDLGYALGALSSGLISDFFGVKQAIWFIALITFLSGLSVALRMNESLKTKI